MKVYKRKVNDIAPLAQADPYMIKGEDGRYYMYATEGQIYSSDKLFGEWKYEGIGLHMPGQKICWAPSVIYLDGKYYMYYSSMDEAARRNMDINSVLQCQRNRKVHLNM